MDRMNRPMRGRKEDGMALVLTLMAVSFMVAVTVQLSTSVNWQMQGAGNIRDSIQLDAINRSGLSLVRAALLADLEENKFDSGHDSWNKLDSSSTFGAGTLGFQITDLSGRLQVNALVPDEKNQQRFTELQNRQIDIWKRLLLSGKFAVEDDQVEELLDAIIDWIDENDEVRDHGAESGYYRGLSPAYSARNAPIANIEELLLIRGMTKELFYGNEEYLGLSPYLTAAGQEGKININSAPLEILMALHQDMNAETAQDLIDFRTEEDNRGALAAPEWYRQLSPIQLDKDMITIQSSCFEVAVTARLNGMTRSGRGVIERDNDKGTQALLSWEVR